MEEEDELQMKSLVQRRENLGGGEASADLESSIQSARGSGQSLDASLQTKMGQAMGADFSGVKVHTDSHSDRLNKSIQARAFTTGQDIFFRQGSYSPSNTAGQELIAHELTHTIQQGASKKLAQKKLSTSINAISRDESVLSGGALSIQRKIFNAHVTQNAHLRDKTDIKKQIGDKIKKGDLIKVDDSITDKENKFVEAIVFDSKTGEARTIAPIGLIRSTSFFELGDTEDKIANEPHKNFEIFDRESKEENFDKHDEKLRKRRNEALKRKIVKDPPNLDKKQIEEEYEKQKERTEEGKQGKVAYNNRQVERHIKSNNLKGDEAKEYRTQYKKLTPEEDRKSRNQEIKKSINSGEKYADKKTYNEQGQEIQDILDRKRKNHKIKTNLKESFRKMENFELRTKIQSDPILLGMFGKPIKIDLENDEVKKKVATKIAVYEYYVSPTNSKRYALKEEKDYESKTNDTEKTKSVNEEALQNIRMKRARATLKYQGKAIEKTEKRRKESNKELKSKFGFWETDKKQEYYDTGKQKSAKTIDKEKVKSNNKQLKINLKNSGYTEGTEKFELEYAKQATYRSGEKGRTQKNKAIKKLVSKDDYYSKHKTLKGVNLGEEFSYKPDETTPLITGIVGGLNTTANYSSLGSNKIGKEIGNTTVSGVKATGKDIAGKDVMEQYGEALQAQMITSSLGDVLGITNSCVGISNGVNRRKSDDPAEKLIGSQDIVNSSFSLGSNVVSFGSDLAKTVRSFTGGTSEVGKNVTQALPIISIVGNVVDLVDSGNRMVQAAHRARKTLKYIKASDGKDKLLANICLTNLREEDLKLVASTTTDMLLTSLQIVGNALTLSGFGAIAGTPLIYAAKIARVAKKIAQIIYAEIYAQKVNNARNKYRDLKKDGKASTTELFLAGKELLEKDPQQAAQSLISQAREPWVESEVDGKRTYKTEPDSVKYGNSQSAIKYLKLFGVNEGDLRNPQMQDKYLRELIFKKIEQDEDPKTIMQKLSDLIAKVKDLPNLKYKIRKGVAGIRKPKNVK